MTDNVSTERKLIGKVIGGSLRDNLKVRLNLPVQEVQEGSFVVVESDAWLFYGLVTDLQLGSTDERFADEVSEDRFAPELNQMLHGQTLYANLEMLPALMLERGPDFDSPGYDAWMSEIESGLREEPRPLPVKTIPSHHHKVYLASEADIGNIFGKVGSEGKFVIGETREQGHKVAIDLKKFVQRSSGIFGATGTGKSFLTRIILAGLIQHNVASVLVFDMHNEYGFDDTATDTGVKVTGLETHFKGKVQVVGLGRGTDIRGQQPSFHLEIAMSDIQPEDIELLTRELNLKETTPTTLEALKVSFGSDWFKEFRAMKTGQRIEDDNGRKIPAPGTVEAWAAEAGVNEMAAKGLFSKLNRVFNRGYIVEKPAQDAITQIIDLLENGKHVFLSFGSRYETDLDYLLVTNLLTRRIKKAWEDRTNDYRSDPNANLEPKNLIVAVEEAHKILNREMAQQTTFSTIAREMRKYYVTLLIIDQRPSQIYDEVMSQLGTRVSGWLGDDDDIRAVLSGISGRDALRGMLARLQPKEEVLLLGWGVPMPLPVRSRRYDQRFWQELKGDKAKKHTAESSLKDLGFD